MLPLHRPCLLLASLLPLFGLVACTPDEEPTDMVSGELAAGHRTVGEGSEISVWLTDETAEIVDSVAIACGVTDCIAAFSTQIILRGTYRDYTAHPVEGVCCDSTLDERTWDSTVRADVVLAGEPDRFVVVVTDASTFEITVTAATERTTGEVDQTITTEGFASYPGLLGRSGSSVLVDNGCEAATADCWTATDWRDADGTPLSDWQEGAIEGELSVVLSDSPQGSE